MADHKFLAFDLGAESGRAVLGILSGGRLVLEEKHRFLNPTARVNGHLHWNLLSQWEELKAGLRKALAHPRERLDGIGVDTWAVDFGLLNRDGEILGIPFHYRDKRTDGMMEVAFDWVSRERIFQRTGIQFLQFNTLFQLLAMRETGSQFLDLAETLLFMPDLFNYLFTGERKSDFTVASTSQMVDPRTRDWAVDIVEELDVPTLILPPIVPAGTVLGPIRADVVAECGGAGTPVIATAGHDTASAVVAVPAMGTDWCYISSGTWSLMGVEIDQPIINDKTFKYNYTNEGGYGGTIRLLKNIMGLWLVQECRREWMRQGQDYSYADLTRMAGDVPPLRTIIDPDHAPFLSPGEMPGKIEQFCNRTSQAAPSSPGEFVRICLDSLALTYRRTLERLEDIISRRVETIHIVGGGAQNELLNQMTADACARTVVAGPVEATAIGNILVQAMAIGAVKSLSSARAIVASSFEVKPYEPRDARSWDEAYERYLELTILPA